MGQRQVESLDPERGLLQPVGMRAEERTEIRHGGYNSVYFPEMSRQTSSPLLFLQ